jgi:hypothetical protein
VFEPIRYIAHLPADDELGLHGGACTLAFAGPVFVLKIDRHYAYGIEEADTVRGAWHGQGDDVVLEAHHWHYRHVETAISEGDRPLTSTWLARAIDAPGPPRAVFELQATLVAEAIDLLLVREDLAAGVLATWLAARTGEREAAHIRLAKERRYARAATASANAFGAREYTRVIGLLEPHEATLSPADRQRLALARRRLQEGAQ